MVSTLRSLRRKLHPFLISPASSTATTSDPSTSWLSAPGNPLMRWPPPEKLSDPKPQPQPNFPSSTPPFPKEKLSDVIATADAISSLIRSTPLSDLKATLIRSGLLPHPNLSSIIDLLIRSHSFDLAWSLLLSHPPSPLSTFATLFRRYARAQKPSSAIRTFRFLHRHPHLFTIDDDHNPLELLLDALCKEGHPKAAAEFLLQFKSEDPPNWIPSVRCYNILLHGWLRQRKLKKAESLWSEMRRDGVSPTVVSYGTVVEGLCRLRRPDQAMNLLEEMRGSGIDPNLLTCNPIVDSLSESGRFSEALRFVERFPLFGISPNISTYNSLIKGLCKNCDLKGVSSVLKTMVARGIVPTTTTYNYLFRYFAKFGKIEEGMNLYNKMVESGYALDRLTYQLLIKMLCEMERLDLAVQLIKDMRRSGFEMDLAMSTMLVHLLLRLGRYDEACKEFEEMFRRGIVPQYITYQKLSTELKRLGLVKLEERISALMNSVPHSTKLPATYRGSGGGEETERQKSIVKMAQEMSEALKERKDKDQMGKMKTSEESIVEKANKLMTSIRRSVYAVKS